MCLNQGRNIFNGRLTEKGLGLKVRVEIDEEIEVYPPHSVDFPFMVFFSQDIVKLTSRPNRIVVALKHKRTLTVHLKRDSSYYGQKHLQPVDSIDRVTFMLEELTPPSQSEENTLYM